MKVRKRYESFERQGQESEEVRTLSEKEKAPEVREQELEVAKAAILDVIRALAPHHLTCIMTNTVLNNVRDLTHDSVFNKTSVDYSGILEHGIVVLKRD